MYFKYILVYIFFFNKPGIDLAQRNDMFNLACKSWNKCFYVVAHFKLGVKQA